MKKTIISPIKNYKLEGIVVDYVCNTGCLASWRVLNSVDKSKAINDTFGNNFLDLNLIVISQTALQKF